MSGTTSPRIYMACLASYNEGMLHGDWIELDGSQDIHDQLHHILETSPVENAEEWAVHDHEHCGALGEYPGLDVLEAIKIAYAQTEEHGLSWEAFVKYCEHRGCDLTVESIIGFRDSYAGSADTLEAWADAFLDETGQLETMPETLRHYFNTEAYARDLEINDVFTLHHEDEVLVFWHS